MKSSWLRVIFSVLAPAAFGQASSPPPAGSAVDRSAAKKTEPIHFEFSLAPKSLQKNPEMELTVITEMTEAGRKLPPVSPDHPAFYVTVNGGYHAMGLPVYGQKTLSAADVEVVLAKSLAGSGYRAVQPPARPDLLIVYSWGADNLAVDPLQGGRQYFLERATLVGGEKFARKMQEVLELVDEEKAVYSDPTFFAFANSLNQYGFGNPKRALMVDQASEELYYVVASAYDYAAATRNEHRLLWRTRMTVNSYGVNQTQSLPTLITNASPFFGKDMVEPEVLHQHEHEGKVEISTPRVVDSPEARAPVGKR